MMADDLIPTREDQTERGHDGKPFTAADVKCTWDMLTGKSQEKLRLNPRKAWYRNLEDIVPEGDQTVTFVLKRSQPAFLMLLASGMSPVYPSDSVLAPLYVGADLLDAFAIHLPAGASDDPEVLARVAFERARHAGTSHLNSSNFPPALLSIASQ